MDMVKTFKITRSTLDRALKYKGNSARDNMLRKAAFQRGGVIYLGITAPKGYLPDVDTTFENGYMKAVDFSTAFFYAASNGLVGHKARTSAGPVFRREDKIRIRRAVRTVEFSIRFRFIVWAGRPGQGPVCDLDRWNIR